MKQMKQLKIITVLIGLLVVNIKVVNGQVCSPTTNVFSNMCVESRAICSLPYVYRYNLTNNAGNQVIVLEDNFNAGSIDGWLPMSTSTKLENNLNRLAISKQSGMGVIGAYKNFNVNAGVTYTLNTFIDRGNCNSTINMIVNIKDAANTVVSTTTITPTS